MKFTGQIPSDFNSNPNWAGLTMNIQATLDWKKEQIDYAMRYYRPPLLTQLPFLRKKVADKGYEPVPSDFPKEILDAMILNAENVMALRGSREGFYYWLWVLTFGDITIDDSAFYPQNDYIELGDLMFGYASYLPQNDSSFTPTLYLFSDVADFGTQTITIAISTKYYYLTSLINYIESYIRNWLSFTDNNTVINITFTPGIYNTYSEPNQYFVIP